MTDSRGRQAQARPRSSLGPPTLGTPLGVPGSSELVPPVIEPPRSPSPFRSPSPLRNPFNFESVDISPAKVASPRPNQRRGHRYKHSSVSINFFQEPEARAPLAIPVSHEIPTLRESLQSASTQQTARVAYCAARIVLVWALFAGPHPTHSTSAFAHLAAYDVVADLVLAGVRVLGNFQVWTQSSLRLPFALQRAEVLLGFALSITLAFFGFDIFSHVIQDIAETMAKVAGAAGGSHHHHHGQAEAHDIRSFAIGTVLILVNEAAVLVRLTNEYSLIGTVTALFGAFMLALPFLPTYLDTLCTPLMALSMVYFGWQVAKYFGGMLVMSHMGPDNTAQLIEAISAVPGVTLVSDIALWQVHHDLWLASAKIVMSGSEEDESTVRAGAEQVFRNILQDVTKLETTIDISRTTLD